MTTSKLRSILRRTATGGALVVLLVLTLLATDAIGNAWPVLAIGTALALGLAVELSRMGTWREARPMPILASALVAAVAVLASGYGALLTYAAAALAATAVALLLRRKRPFALVLLAVWSMPALPALALVYERGSGVAELVALILLSKIGDIAGYYAGNALGRHHPFPRLSPGKTTEGCLASLVVGAAAGPACGALGLLPNDAGWLLLIAAGALVNVAAQAGDLLESAVKRRSGVKDSSTWLGASGGLLDVTDSLLLTVPVALATFSLFFS